MMGHHERLKGGDEQDAFRARHLLNWRPGVLHRIKQAFSKRVRKEARRESKTDGQGD